MSKTRAFLKAGVTAVALSAPVVASAHWFSASGLYIGAGGGLADNRSISAGNFAGFVNLHHTHAAYKGYVGLAFNRYFAIQAGYQDFGKDTISTPIGSETIRNRGYDLNALLGFPFTPRFTLFIEGGASRFRTDTATPVSSSVAHDGTHPDYGAGVQYYFLRHVAIRGQWQEFRIPNNNTQLYSGSLLFRF